MLFTYAATDKDGKTIQGSAQAVNKEAVVAMLHKQGVHPLLVKLESTKHRGLSMGHKVKNKDLVVFTRQLSTMISAGVSLTRSLSTLETQTTNKFFKQAIAAITKDIEGGMPLADAFAKYPTIFNEVYVNMVRAGEAGGILDEILKRLAAQVEQDSSMRKKIKSAATYPVVILTITIIAFFGIMMFIIPKIASILKDIGNGAKLPIYTQAMLGASDFVRSYFIFIIIFMVGGVYLFRRYIKTPKGRYKFHETLLKIPVLKDLIIKIAVARFARTFASLMSAGVTVLDALSVTGGAIGNKVIQKELENAATDVRNGKQLSEPLSKSKHFPPIIAQMLAVGEETGQIDTILVKVADFYEEDVNATVDALSSLIEPLMIIVLGCLVGLIAASVMGPIASLNQNIGK